MGKAKDSRTSAHMPKIDGDRQYHIGLKKGEIAEFILLCGDVDRVHKVAKFLKNPTTPIKCREYTTISGSYDGINISVMATGMGPDNTEMALVEISQIASNPTFIRVGSSGAIQKNIAIGDLVISTAAVRMENTSTKFVTEGYPAFANHEVLLALISGAQKQKRKFHVGLTATASGFYGAQGRQTPVYKSRIPDLPDELEAMNVANMEMEASTLFTLATLGGYRAGAVCAIYAQRQENKFIDKATKEAAELDAIKTALSAVKILHKMDQQKGKNKYWTPSLGE